LGRAGDALGLDEEPSDDVITGTVTVSDHFPEVTEEIERLAIQGLNRAAEVGAREAERLAAPGLKQHARMDVIRAHGTPDGYATGFRSSAKGARGQDIAVFHDKGTYGNYRGRSTPRRRGRAQKVADVNPETGEKSGIVALGFFGAGRREGKRELQRVIQSAL
jgi:hypothetical protein